MTESAAQEARQEAWQDGFQDAAESAEAAATEPGPTGVPAVDDALDRLTSLEGLPVDEHPAVFESVHGSLRGVLGSDGA